MDLNYDNMDDDLFGDSVPVALPNINAIPAPPPVKGLAGRLDELSTSGCCSRMGWSKNGCLAYIAPGGKAINLRVFLKDTTTGKWDLADDSPVEIPPGHGDYPFVHLTWSHLGNDLAVVNSAGHVLLFSGTIVLDRMSAMRLEPGPPESDSDAVVGMHWLAILPYGQKNQIAWGASKVGEKWVFNVKQRNFNDMHHPAEGKASLICMKRNGEIRLRFQQPDSSWSEAVTQVAWLTSTREAFTHAAFASNNDNTLLLTACDVAGRLHLYRIEASWNVPPMKPGQPPPKQYEKPNLQVSGLVIDEDCSPAMINNNLSAGTEAKVRVPAQLTHLDFFPITPEENDGSLPTIQAIFSTPPDIVAVNQTQPQQNPFSIVTRWEVHRMEQNQLHSSLDKVTSKKKSVSSVPSRTVWELKRQTDTMMHSVVLSFFPLWYQMVLGYSYSDGTIEFRKRSTMARIEPDYNSEAVTSMTQAGFAFTSAEPSLHTALSPNNCMAACMQQERSIQLRSMEYTYGSLATDDDEPRHSAALAALVLQSTTAANQYFCSDDIFSVMGELSETRKTQFIDLLFEGLRVNIDCGYDDQNNYLVLLGRSPFFVKTLSAIHILGLQGSVNRSLTSKMAWIVLNIKYVTQILTTIARMHGAIEKNHLRVEVVPQFVGICRWIMHFQTYLLDELIQTGRLLQPLIAQSPNGLTREILEKHIHDANRPALLILLSAFPRTMLKLWAQPIHWVYRTAATMVNGQTTPENRRIYAPLHQAFHEASNEFRHFEVLVSETQHLIQNIYKQFPQRTDDDKKSSALQRNLLERELLQGRIPDALFPAANMLITDMIFNDAVPNGCLLAKIDVPKVSFFDTTWLGFTSSKRAAVWFDAHVVDVCQKTIIRGEGAQALPSNPPTAANQQPRNRSDSIQSVGGMVLGEDGRRKKPQLRKCVRCGAYMEDVLMGMPGYTNVHVSWLMGVAKHCVCGNAWMLAPEKKKAK